MGFSKELASSPHLPHQPGPLIATCACAMSFFSHSGFQFTTLATAPLNEAIAYRFFLVAFSTHVTAYSVKLSCVGWDWQRREMTGCGDLFQCVSIQPV